MIKLKIYKHNSIKTSIDDDILKIPKYFSSDFVKQYINEEIVYDVENTNLGAESSMVAHHDDRFFTSKSYLCQVVTQLLNKINQDELSIGADIFSLRIIKLRIQLAA